MILRPPHRQIYKERPRDFDVRTRRLAERWKREKEREDKGEVSHE